MAYVRLCKQCHADFDTDAQLHGNALHNARLTEELVREIRKRYAAGETYASLAEELHIHRTTVQYAGSGKTWKWVK
jgi:DNA invertase Pin-like site-specific DNA recombinase